MTALHRFVCLLLVSLCATKSLSTPSVQIQGNLLKVSGSPRWLILLRNPDNGSTTPWIYDFTNTASHWLILPTGNTYQIVASELLFGDNHTIFHNFCGIEDGILTERSIQVNLSGQLTPTTDTIHCQVRSYPSG